MARIRTIKPEFWTDERLSALPEATHLLAAALLNHSDDEGYFNANHALIKAACSPIREPSVTIPESLERLAGVGYLSFGAGSDGRHYGRIVNFHKHQKVNRPSPSRIKPLVTSFTGSRNGQGPLTEPSLAEQGTGNREQGTICGDDATASEGSENGSGTAPCYPQAFEEFWLAYPTRGGRKRGKGTCLGIWRQAIRAADRRSLVEAAKHYAASDESTRGYARDPQRFLAKDWWRDWVPAAVDGASTRPAPIVAPPIQARIKPADFTK